MQLIVAQELVALQRRGHAVVVIVAHHFAHATKTDLLRRVPHGQRNEVFNRLTYGQWNIGNKQHAVGAHVTGFGDARLGCCPAPDKFNRELQFESDGFALVRHVKLNVLELACNVNTKSVSKVPVRVRIERVWKWRAYLLGSESFRDWRCENL